MKCFSGPELQDKFMSEFDCQPYESGRIKESRQRSRRREAAQSTLESFNAVRAIVTTPSDAVIAVKADMRTKMGPVGIFIFWSIFGAIIQKMVFWLWDHASIEISA